MRYLPIALVMLLVSLVRLSGQDCTVKPTDDFAKGSMPPYSSVMPGDTVWIQSGNRSELKFTDFHGEPGKPIVFANKGGQVVIETDNSYGLSFEGCSFFKLVGLPGNGYSYGILIARVTNASGMGISASNKSTDIEIENCEVSNTGFAGIRAKTDLKCADPGTYRDAFTQYNTIIHDCYVHDVGGEGMYIGNTSYEGEQQVGCTGVFLPSVLIGTHIYNNRVERTGYDGIQVSSAIRDCEIHHNLLVDCSYKMSEFQMSGIIIGGGTQARCFNNRIIDCYATGILLFGKGGTEVFNNLIVRPGNRFMPLDPPKQEHGIFVSDKTQDEKTFYGIYNNTIIQPKSDAVRIDNTVDFPVLIYNNALVAPGAFKYYETDNTDRTGQDAFIFDSGKNGWYEALNNYFAVVAADCAFASLSGDDYHLTENSPLIDSGKNLESVGITMDLDDGIRPLGAAFDVGAYEYSGSQTIPDSSLNDDFSVLSVVAGSHNDLSVELNASGEMAVRVCLLDILGKVYFEQAGAKLNPGRNELLIPAVPGGLFILVIQSDRMSYARKFVLL